MTDEKYIQQNFPNLLPLEPSINDLKKYSRIKLKKHRNLKKFVRHPQKYVKPKIWNEYLGKILCKPIKRALNYNDIGQKIIMVEELPETTITKFQEGMVTTKDSIVTKFNFQIPIVFNVKDSTQ